MPSFKDLALSALSANGHDADELLRRYESVGWDQSILTVEHTPNSVEHERMKYEFRCRGCCLNYELVARLEGGKDWLVVASLRLEDSDSGKDYN